MTAPTPTSTATTSPQSSPKEDSILDYASELRHSILRSISHNESVRIEVPTILHEATVDCLSDLDEIDYAALDSVRENDGSLDVWGTFRGEDFRIRLVNGEAL